MNKDFMRLLAIPMMFDGPYSTQGMKMGSSKKSPVRGRMVGCVRCGASQCTLRKLKVGFGRDAKERLLCPKCYAKESKNA